MNPSLNAPIVVAIETDATRYHGEHPVLPALLDRGEAEQLLAHLSSDLSELIPAARRCRLAMPGALYDQTQLLRPAYPVFQALEDAAAGGPGEAFTPHLLSIGALDGHMPREALQPEVDIPPGTLQLLPLLVCAEDADGAAWFEDMEHRFLEEGQVSPHTAQALQSAFGIVTRHARFMTLTDLMALLHLQLEHFGFLPLWELLDAALEGAPGPMAVKGRLGQSLEWRDGAVTAVFETFDHWASQGGGRSIADDPTALAEGYADWTREYRQYLVTLAAHGIEVRQSLPGQDAPLEGAFLVEETPLPDSDGAARVTEHARGELGVIAISLAAEGRLRNHYPLTPGGLNAIHDALRDETVAAGGLAYPGDIRCDAAARRLAPDSL